MNIKKIEVKNYRLLEDFSIDLEEKLSLVIGKNNTGKTSLLLILDKFLNHSDKSQFSYDDFNIDCKKSLEAAIEGNINEEATYEPIGISLKIYIEYEEKDDLSNISQIIMSLEPDNNFVILKFEYILTYDDFDKLKQEFKEKELKQEFKEKEDIRTYLKQKHSDYFQIFIKSVEYDVVNKQENELNFIDLNKEKISLKNIINFKYIKANREVSNKNTDATLSLQTSKIYKKTETNGEQKDTVENFKAELARTDSSLNQVYTKLFKDVIEKVKKFGGMEDNDSTIEIISSLQDRELLDSNTTVMYNHNSHSLPENYNGLGYMNLINMIFEIEIIINEFGRNKDEKPADINLFFIEEPEAHTHPQMQYVFIKNIKNLLKNRVGIEELQYIISTHSSHVVSESDFNDIKYLKKSTTNSVVAKNLTDLEKEYAGSGEENNYRFLKKYLTLNRAEFFFADKAILIEGDTERILLPAMMKKVDQEEPDNPMLSQNISIVEVGAYSHIFEKFIDFIGIKTLIITDIDCGKKEKIGERVKSCSCSDNPTETTNSSLKYFYKSSDFNAIEPATFKKESGKWKKCDDEKGKLRIAFQIKENGYHARSFEDAFFQLNKEFIVNSENNFESLTKKWVEDFKEETVGVYVFAENAVGSKPSLAIEILLNSKTKNEKEFSNWKTPSYIEEGLKWLKKN